MRIALVTTSYPSHAGDPSGHFVSAEVDALRREGHEVSVIRPDVGGAFGWPGVAARIRQHPLRVAEAIRWIARARAELAALEADRVIAHWAIPSAWPIATIAPSVPLEIVSHGGDVRLLRALPRRAREHVVARLVARARWRFVSAPLRDALASALSPKLASALRSQSWIAAPPLSITDDLGPASRVRRDASGGRELYVAAGRLVAEKRVASAVTWVAARARSARADGGASPRLVVVGDGPERERLTMLARELEVDAEFVGLTTRQEALTWIGAADALLFGSRAEGLSTVLREAEALGVRVLRV